MVNFVKNMINKDKKVNMSLSCKTVYNKYENKTKDIEFFKEIFSTITVLSNAHIKS